MKRMKDVYQGLLILTLLLAATASQAVGFEAKYIARNGDINGDGIVDLYLEHRPVIAMVNVDDISIPIPTSKSALRRFVLEGTSSGGYSLLTELSSYQQSQVRAWPSVTVGVSAEDFNRDGVLDLFVSGIPTSNPSIFRDVGVLAPSSSQSLATIDAEATKRYVVRVGDLNGDGKSDLFVTGNANRAVADFVLQQSSGQKFSVLMPTAAQRGTASGWPTTNIAVFREDLNYDGYFDFIFENVDETIAGAPDLVVFTARRVGTTPTKVVHLDNNFYRAFEQIDLFLHKPRPIYNIYTGWSCTSINVPVFSLSWAAPGGTIFGSNWDDDRQLSYPYLSFAQTDYCSGNQSLWEPAARTIMDNYATRLSCRSSCAADATQTAANAGYTVVPAVGAAALVLSRAAFKLTLILIADDATGVGTVDDFLIPITASIAAGAYVVWIVANAPNDDVTPPAPQSTTADPFQLPPDCKPDDPARRSAQILAGNGAPSSKRLGDNLTKMGCAKPHSDAQAHHIVQKNARSIQGQKAIDLLKEVGIDIDEASNGVWLPKGENVITRARPHLGRGMHSFDYDQAVHTRLMNAANRGATPAARQAEVRAELSRIRNELLSNDFKF